MTTRRYLVLRIPGGGQLGGPEAMVNNLVEDADVSAVIEEADDRGAQELRADPDNAAVAPEMEVRLIEPTGVEDAAATAGDAWGLAAVGATTTPYDGKGVTVAVLDTGIDDTHEAFKGVNILQKDFTGTAIGDNHGHGTHCAGTIFGRDVGGRRIGVARGVTDALIGKVLNDSGRGSTVGILDGIKWAVDKKAHVISLSLGIDPMATWKSLVAQGWKEPAAVSAALQAFGENLRYFDTLLAYLGALGAKRGTVVVAATGNESMRPTYVVGASLPAAAKGMLSVGAIGRREAPDKDKTPYEVASFSNTDPKLVAPGVSILSARCAARGGGLTLMDGTSMATPHAAGVAALWWQALANEGPTSEEVVARLLATSRKGGIAPPTKADRGVGLVTAPAKQG